MFIKNVILKCLDFTILINKKEKHWIICKFKKNKSFYLLMFIKMIFSYLFESKHVTTEGYRVGCAGFRSSETTGCDMSVLTKLLSMFGKYLMKI